jgi:hypothetical protein
VLQADGNADAFRLFEERLGAVAWAVYRVRRIVWSRGRADRKTEKVAEGPRENVAADILEVRKRTGHYPSLEVMLVAAPAVGSARSADRPSRATGRSSRAPRSGTDNRAAA